MREHLLRCAAWSLLALACAAASAQGEATGFSSAGGAGQRPDEGQAQVRRFDLWPEADGSGRGALVTLPRLIGDAPVAEHGINGAPGGYGGFVEWSMACGSESLRDARIAVGMKISR